MDDFEPGDLIEFFSDENGGMWKPGIVDKMTRSNNQIKYRVKSVRIHVGNGVYIIRPRAKCRLVEQEAKRTA